MVYPGHAKLTEAEKTSICYLAFPDSNSGCMGDSVFHFRTRRLSTLPPPSPALRLYHRSAPNPLQVILNLPPPIPPFFSAANK